jgi:hypothetical protein
VVVTEGEREDECLLVVGADEVLIPGDGSFRQCILAFLGFVNDLLRAHGSPERAHALYAGSQVFVIVLATPEMASVLDDAGDVQRLFST